MVMANTPSEDVVPNFGKGPITYITANMGLAEIVGDDKLKAIEELVHLPLGQSSTSGPLGGRSNRTAAGWNFRST